MLWEQNSKMLVLIINKFLRSYQRHLSGVYSLEVHKVLRVLVSWGRNIVAHVWDIRVCRQIHDLVGYTVGSILTQ